MTLPGLVGRPRLLPHASLSPGKRNALKERHWVEEPRWSGRPGTAGRGRDRRRRGVPRSREGNVAGEPGTAVRLPLVVRAVSRSSG
ncbi:hypothetical protein GCM10010360_40790 [Streptomyces nogalater]